MAAILKFKMGARRTTASTFPCVFFNLYRYIATIFSSLGSSEVEIKPKYVTMAAILKSKMATKRTMTSYLLREFIAILSIINVSNATFLNSPGSSEAQI